MIVTTTLYRPVGEKELEIDSRRVGPIKILREFLRAT
jgi:hypothetical protein